MLSSEGYADIMNASTDNTDVFRKVTDLLAKSEGFKWFLCCVKARLILNTHSWLFEIFGVMVRE